MRRNLRRIPVGRRQYRRQYRTGQEGMVLQAWREEGGIGLNGPEAANGEGVEIDRKQPEASTPVKNIALGHRHEVGGRAQCQDDKTMENPLYPEVRYVVPETVAHMYCSRSSFAKYTSMTSKHRSIRKHCAHAEAQLSGSRLLLW